MKLLGFIISSICISILFASTCPAEIKKCINQEGKITFSNMGCPEGYVWADSYAEGARTSGSSSGTATSKRDDGLGDSALAEYIRFLNKNKAAANARKSESTSTSSKSSTTHISSSPNCQFDPNCLGNPYGAGSPYKPDGVMNPYSQYGSQYSNKSWTNPYATDAPKLYDSNGNYKGKLSSNPYDPDSTSNPYGRYGSKFSPDSINNPYGAGSPYSGEKIQVVPSR